MSTWSMMMCPVDGASSPAMSPSSVDFPLPDGRGDDEVQRVQDRQRAAAARHGPRNPAQLDHEEVTI
jgi:hypothetical protein